MGSEGNDDTWWYRIASFFMAMQGDTADVTELSRRWQWEILEHPPYSPDMSSCDYGLFAKVVVVGFYDTF